MPAQQFMLANDSVTLAVEVSIWLSEEDIAALEAKHGIEIAPVPVMPSGRLPDTWIFTKSATAR